MKKTDWRIIVLIVAAVALMGYFGGLFSVVPQDRPTADNKIDLIEGIYSAGQKVYSGYSIDGTGVAGSYNYGTSSCPNLESVDFCRVYFGTASAGMGSVGSVGGFIDTIGTNPQVYGVPLRLEKGHSFIWAVSSGQKFIAALVTFENFMQCSDGSYNYRSSCPKENSQMPVIVRDLKNDATIPGASVSISGKSVKPAQTTDNNGVTVFSVYPGTYIITASKDGYKTGTLQYSAVEPVPNIPYNSAVIRLEKTISYPPEPPKPIWETIWGQIADFFAELFKNIRFFSITGTQTVAPNSVNQYVISLPAATPIDSDYSDGKYQYRYANWAFTNRSGAIKQQGTWESIQNSYEKTVSITAPSSPSDYAIIATIYEYDYVFDSASNSWKIASEKVIAKEGINVGTRVTIQPAPPAVQPDFGKIISDAISGFFSWLSSFFK